MKTFTLKKTFALWLVLLPIMVAITAEYGWQRKWVILLVINAGIAIISLLVSYYAHRSIRRFGTIPPEQRERELSKLPPLVRDIIVRDLNDHDA